MNARAKNKIRLYLPQSLAVGKTVTLSAEEAHYLGTVMRSKIGDTLSCFNEHDGEYDCCIAEIGKKNGVLEVINQLRQAQPTPDIWLCFAPLKKDKTDFVIEKSTELGVREIIPVITKNTITDKVRTDRFALQAKEAAEQCERTDVPLIQSAISLEKLLHNWPKERMLFFMDESLSGEPAQSVFTKYKGKAAAILVGPEGGFSKEEKALLDSLDFVCGVALGPRILRAETAVCAALSIWQATAGDWNKGE